ncbi:cell division protein PerM [Blastococcus tunisiensis]|uniref:Uncharacterized protein n=1 Tax=Blastococcus tunisiensis TaxID=1798228 RepID=A0A1I1WB16_9ACTN|nr:DUF6350 family protein [Blastococcus sp. DSM 46838]SFD92302.1 hypothetical protein SAMN05216574_101311 [Blastococcus sp. DSM 46838]
MVSLLARLPRGNHLAALPLAGLAAAASVAVSAAALAGLALALVVVQTLDPAGGQSVGDSVVLAGRLLLLAQGGELRLASGPLVLAPLLLTLGLAWGLSQAGRGIARLRAPVSPRDAVRTVGVVAGVHVLLVLGLALVVDAPEARVGLIRTALGATVLAVLAAGWGVLRESGLLDDVLDRGPARAVLRGVLAGLLTALGLCTVVVAVAVVSDAGGHAALAGSLGGAGAGAVGLLGLELVLLPNAAAAVLGLAAGPGFHVGSGTLVSVHGVTLDAVPALPLLAALPDTQAVPLIAFASQAVPALAGLVAGLTMARWLRDDAGGSVVAGLTGILTGGLLGVAAGLLVWLAGGSLGDGALAEVGAPPIATAVAIAAQAAIAAAVGAAVSRWRALG